MMRRGSGRLEPADDTVIRGLYPALHRFASAVGGISDADDLVQEALARTIARSSLAELDDPLPYLRRVVLNLAANRRRTVGRQLRAWARMGVAGPGTADSYPSDLAPLMALPPQARAVLWLADVEGLSFPAIAQQLGLTPAAARKQASRGRAELRRGWHGVSAATPLTDPTPVTTESAGPR